MIVYSMDEAAEKLRVSRRWLQGFISKHPFDPAGKPYYVPLGNRKKFTENDLERILAASREEERLRLEELYRPRQRVRKQRINFNPHAPELKSSLERAVEIFGPKLQRRLEKSGKWPPK